MEEHVPTHCKPTTAHECQGPAGLFIEPGIGRRRVTEIQRSDIPELRHRMRKMPWQANRALTVPSKMFHMAKT